MKRLLIILALLPSVAFGQSAFVNCVDSIYAMYAANLSHPPNPTQAAQMVAMASKTCRCMSSYIGDTTSGGGGLSWSDTLTYIATRYYVLTHGGSTDSTIYSTKAWRQKGIDSINANYYLATNPSAFISQVNNVYGTLITSYNDIAVDTSKVASHFFVTSSIHDSLPSLSGYILWADTSATGGASNVVSRDGNGNTHSNNFESAVYTITATAGTTTVNAAIPRNILVTGSTTQTFQLTDATTLHKGHAWEFNNNTTNSNIYVTNNSGGAICTVPKGGYAVVTLTYNYTSDGTWDYHYWMPSSSVGAVVYSVSATSPTTVSAASGAVNIGMPQSNTTTNGWLSSTDWNTFNGKGSGTVTNVGSGFGTNFTAITTTGSVVVDSTVMATKAALRKTEDSLNATIATKGSGTVTSVAGGRGITGGTITSTGTLGLDTTQAYTWIAPQTISITGNGTSTGTGQTIQNSTAATAGTQNQYSPILHQIGNAWNSTSTASNTIDYYWQVQTTAGASPIGNYVLKNSINGAAATTGATFSASGGCTIAGSLVSSGGFTASSTASIGSTLTIGGKIAITTGSNKAIGTCTLSSGTCTFSSTVVTASSTFILNSTATVGCTTCGTLGSGTVTAGTSVVINSSNALDSRVVTVIVIN